MRKLVCAAAVIGMVGVAAPGLAQEAEPLIETPAIESPATWSVDKTTVVTLGALAGYVLATTPVSVPAIIGAAAGSGVAYWWYGTTDAP